MKGSYVICPKGRPFTVGKDRYYRVRDLFLKPDEPERAARWKHAIELAVLEAGRPKHPLAGVPITISATFYLHRPKKPEHALPVGRVGDLDKLQRKAGDVLTGVYFVDDSQVADWHASKRYEDADHPEGAVIVIESLDPQQPDLVTDQNS